MTRASASGKQLGHLVVLEPADELDRAGSGFGRLAHNQPAAPPGRRTGSATASPPHPRALDQLPQPHQLRRGPLARAQPRGGEAPPRTRRIRQFRDVHRDCASCTNGHAASSRSTPLETISLPTKTTLRGWRGLGGAENGGAAPARRAPRGRDGSRGRNLSVSTPGGPSRVFPLSPATSGSAFQSDSAVCREPTSTPEAASMPSSA